jgi:hypothetical protein
MSKPTNPTPKAKTERLIVREIDGETLSMTAAAMPRVVERVCREGLAQVRLRGS